LPFSFANTVAAMTRRSCFVIEILSKHLFVISRTFDCDG
jgi:hypothetical protein